MPSSSLYFFRHLSNVPRHIPSAKGRLRNFRHTSVKLPPDNSASDNLLIKEHDDCSVDIKYKDKTIIKNGYADGGGLVIGKNPSLHRIIENGSDIVFDFVTRLRTGDVARNPLVDIMKIPVRGNSISILTRLFHL